MRNVLRVGVTALAIGGIFSATETTLRAEPFNQPGTELTKQILQRKDKPLRQQALDRAKAMLSGEAVEKKDALAALSAAGEVPFDRKPFAPLIRECLTDVNPDVRAAALWALPATGGDASDHPAIAKLADDPSPAVRQRVVSAIVFNSKNKPSPPAEVLAPVVEKLLNDSDASVRREALRATWGVPVSEAAEKRMIELSKIPESGYDAVYFGLSTRPKKSKAVCERLVEVMREGVSSGSDAKGRAAWGLTYGVSGEAAALVSKAVIDEVDETLDPYVRDNCIRVLGQSGGDDALKKLRELAEKDESERVREAAKGAVRGR